MREAIFSLIIPARNEEQFIAQCLDSVLTQSYPQHLIEVFVVDGMSTDGTVKIVEEYMHKYPNFHLLTNEQKVTPISMNMGIRASRGDIVAILGAHAYLDPDFIRNNVRNLTEKDAQCSGGPIVTISDGEMSKSIALAMSSPFGVGNARFRYSQKEQYVDTVAFGAYLRDWIEKIGLFDEQLIRNQDDEINFRLIRAGGKILLSPDIRSFYYSRGSLPRLWRQYYQYGFWKVLVIRKHGRPASIRHLVPAGFVFSLLLTIIGGIIWLPIFWLTVLLLVMYLAGDILFAARLAASNGARYFLRLIPVFPVLHFSYGLGFLSGILHFAFKKSAGKAMEKNSGLSR